MCMINNAKMTKELIEKAVRAKKNLKMYKLFDIVRHKTEVDGSFKIGKFFYKIDSPYRHYDWELGENTDPSFKGKVKSGEKVKFCFHLCESLSDAKAVKETQPLFIIIPVYVNKNDICYKGNYSNFSGNPKWDKLHFSVGVKKLTLKKEDVLKTIKENAKEIKTHLTYLR